MNSQPCDALRQIRLGHLGVEGFAPPEVYTSGLFRQYGVTIADLRRHLLDCSSCAATMDEVRTQLRHFDETRLSTLNDALKSFEKLSQKLLQSARMSAEDEAADVADLYLESEGINDKSLRQCLIESEAEEIFERKRREIYLSTVKLHVLLAGPILRWLETFLPPRFPRIVTIDKGGKVSDVVPQVDDLRKTVYLAKDFIEIFPNISQEGASHCLRALYLAETFGGMWSVDELKQLRKSELESSVPNAPGVDWEKVLQHYSMLADLETNRFSLTATRAGSLQSPVLQEGIKSIMQMLEPIESIPKILQNTEDLRHGQTAVMDLITEIGKVEHELLEAYEKAPAEKQKLCEERVRTALGEMFDALAPRSRKFLVSAEFGYSETLPDLDFSGVIVLFMKAFEHELSRAMEPFRDELERLVASDSILSKKANKGIGYLTLGDRLGFLKRRERDVAHLFQDRGLSVKEIREAIEKVNKEKGAKHRDEKGFPSATSFRDLFLGARTVWGAIFPDSRRAKPA